MARLLLGCVAGVLLLVALVMGFADVQVPEHGYGAADYSCGNAFAKNPLAEAVDVGIGSAGGASDLSARCDAALQPARTTMLLVAGLALVAAVGAALARPGKPVESVEPSQGTTPAA